MRLLMFKSASGEAHLGVLRGEQVIDLSLWLGQNTPYNRPEPMDMLYLIKKGEGGLAMVRKALEAADSGLDAATVLLPLEVGAGHVPPLLAPIQRPPKNVLCMGRNYF